MNAIPHASLEIKHEEHHLPEMVVKEKREVG